MALKTTLESAYSSCLYQLGLHVFYDKVNPKLCVFRSKVFSCT